MDADARLNNPLTMALKFDHGRLAAIAAFERQSAGAVHLEQLAASARSLLGENREVFEPVTLSPRQIDCVALVAQGKSDWEISQILGLGRDTVHEYVEGARRRYDVRRRTQLVLRAVRDGHLRIDALL